MVNTGHATEAYDNFSRYGGQYDSVDQVPGYADWAASNPDLVAYANQGFTSGRSSADSSQAMTDFMNEWRVSQAAANEPPIWQESADNAAANPWYTDRSASWRDIQAGMDGYGTMNGTGDYAVFGGKNWESFSNNSGSGNQNLTDFNRAMDARDFSGVGTVYDMATGRNLTEHYTSGWGAWNEGYGTYRAFGEQATNTVDQQLNERRTNAALLGIDFEVNDEARQTMINDEFAGLWTAEDQTAMEALAEFEDNSTGPTAYDFTRGDAANAMTDQSGTSTLVTEGSGVAPTSSTRSLLDDEETTTTLGA